MFLHAAIAMLRSSFLSVQRRMRLFVMDVMLVTVNFEVSSELRTAICVYVLWVAVFSEPAVELLACQSMRSQSICLLAQSTFLLLRQINQLPCVSWVIELLKLETCELLFFACLACPFGMTRMTLSFA